MEREPQLQFAQPVGDDPFSFGADGDRLRPPGGDVGGIEGVEEVAIVVASLVADQIDLHEPGFGVVPFPPCLHRDRGLQHRPRPGVTDRLAGRQSRPGWCQPPVDRRGRHREDLVDHFPVDTVEVAVVVHVGQRLRQRRMQAFAGGPVQRCPAADQQRDRVIVVDPDRVTGCPRRGAAAGSIGERLADRFAGMIAMPAGDLGYRVQDR